MFSLNRPWGQFSLVVTKSVAHSVCLFSFHAFFRSLIGPHITLVNLRVCQRSDAAHELWALAISPITFFFSLKGNVEHIKKKIPKTFQTAIYGMNYFGKKSIKLIPNKLFNYVNIFPHFWRGFHNFHSLKNVLPFPDLALDF